VPPGEAYEQVRQQIIEQAKALIDPQTGQPIVEAAYRREEIYDGDQMDLMPDIVLMLHHDYMAGTRTAPPMITSVSAATLERTSGQHKMDGIFVARGKAVKQGAALAQGGLMDIAPTVLYALDVPVPQEMDGRVLDIFDPAYREAHPVRYADAQERESAVLEDTGLTAEEEEQIKRQLERLGYL
jgi:predicted AlkP superfamily phosphohydrolase/phosphomutase